MKKKSTEFLNWILYHFNDQMKTIQENFNNMSLNSKILNNPDLALTQKLKKNQKNQKKDQILKKTIVEETFQGFVKVITEIEEPKTAKLIQKTESTVPFLFLTLDVPPGFFISFLLMFFSGQTILFSKNKNKIIQLLYSETKKFLMFIS